MLGDGSVVPSFLNVQVSNPHESAYARGVSDSFLRCGRVSKVYNPDDDGNQSKKFFEYDVEVDYYEGSGSYSKLVYPRARIASVFGAVGDYTHYTPRIVSQQDTQINQGSLVLVLCVNGDSRQAVIVGGIAHPSLPKEDPNDGHHLGFEFNGINVDINKDGTLTLVHKGATDPDGTVQNDTDQTNGTSIQLDENGDIWLQTGKNGDNVVHLDSQNVKIRVDATQGDVEINAQANVKITSQGVLTGTATDHTMMGDTYRNAEKTLHNKLQVAFTNLQSALSTIATQLGAAGTAMLIPTTGPVAAAPLVSAAAGGASTAAGLCSQMAQAITDFEAQSAPYLSAKNKSD